MSLIQQIKYKKFHKITFRFGWDMVQKQLKMIGMYLASSLRLKEVVRLKKLECCVHSNVQMAGVV